MSNPATVAGESTTGIVSDESLDPAIARENGTLADIARLLGILIVEQRIIQAMLVDGLNLKTDYECLRRDPSTAPDAESRQTA